MGKRAKRGPRPKSWVKVNRQPAKAGAIGHWQPALNRAEPDKQATRLLPNIIGFVIVAVVLSLTTPIASYLQSFTATSPLTPDNTEVPASDSQPDYRHRQVVAPTPVGRHLLGDGWSIRISTTIKDELQIECLYDDGYLEATREPGYTTTAPTPRKLQPIGGIYRVKLDSDHIPVAHERLEWFHNGEYIRAFIGTPGDDTFDRPAGPSRCLFVSLGGNDVVRLRANRPTPANDRLVTEKGTVIQPTFVPGAPDNQPGGTDTSQSDQQEPSVTG